MPTGVKIKIEKKKTKKLTRKKRITFMKEKKINTPGNYLYYIIHCFSNKAFNT